MKNKTKTLVTALFFPALFIFIRTALPSLVYAVTLARLQAGADGVEGELLRNQARLIMRTATPWLAIASMLLTLLIVRLVAASNCVCGRGTWVLGCAGSVNLRKVFRLIGLALLLHLALNVMLYILPLPAAWYSEHADRVSTPFGAAGIAAQILLVAIAAPITEEIIFRGLCFRFLRQGGFSFLFAVILQAVVFAFAHNTALQVVYAFPSAVVFAVVYVRYKTLAAPIIMHMAFNSVSLLLTLIQ